MFYQSYSNILLRLRQPAIFEPDDIGKSYIPKRKPWIDVNEITSIHEFLWSYITLSYIIWLKNSRLSKFDKNIGIWLLKHVDLYISLRFV